MIHLRDNISSAPHLHSEKIRISQDASILEIERELPHNSTKFNSRYEIYNSTTRPFGKSYRELTLSSSGSCVSGRSESQSSLNSSGLSETTTYIRCCSEIEPIQMTGFQCIDETTRHHMVSIINAENYDHIHEATNYEVTTAPTTLSFPDNNGPTYSLEPDKTEFLFYPRNVQSDKSDNISLQKNKLVNIENWSSSVKKEQPLKSPTLLRQMISELESQHQHLSGNVSRYEKQVHKTQSYSNSNKNTTKCKSMLNLELKQDPTRSTINSIIDTKNQSNSSDESAKKQQEKERITKTISVMLENRRKQLYQPVKVNDKPSQDAIANDKLTNNNVELIEGRNTHTLNRSCRVTGEILKHSFDNRNSEYSRNASTLPRAVKSHRSQLQRHFYYPLNATKSSNRVRDDELPDPDKVKHVRKLFENVLKIGSLENVNTLPRTAKKQNPRRPTPEIRQPDSGFRRSSPQLQKCLSIDASSIGHNYKWTDNGSFSSGVGSDVSVETDCETISKSDISGSGSDNGCNKDAIFSSDEDLFSSNNGEEAGKPISQDILENIRAYGTTTTYYGGKIIASSDGYSCSPITMTIMNEIRKSKPDYHENRKFLFDNKEVAKFRLVKSNSCGSRLELSATEEYGREYEQKSATLGNDRKTNETKRGTSIIEEEEEPIEKLAQITKSPVKIEILPQRPEKRLELNKVNHQKPESKSYSDMEFEEFEVLEEKT